MYFLVTSKKKSWSEQKVSQKEFWESEHKKKKYRITPKQNHYLKT